ncbi:YlbD family protein [Neobacillus sp. PS3-34]|uniref:YlbD family protein n=1 Tax=Neobacillus sp. PS3-34 TaxID=3070678 RepID=UPI0027DF5AF4|nr:YlbD family protein [Neobacillus sp. PS3-34]WML49371.1 YlbD family protein [Neobacillus sp. PS3-34]
MEQKKLHPSVLKFKEFVKNNPKIINEVRSGKSSWQDLYEDWYLLGEEDEKWNAFRSEHSTKGTSGNKEADDEKKGDWMSQLTGMAKKIDPGQMQVYINNASQALGPFRDCFHNSRETASRASLKLQKVQNILLCSGKTNYRKDTWK